MVGSTFIGLERCLLLEGSRSEPPQSYNLVSTRRHPSSTMNRLSREKRARILALLCEGAAMRTITRVEDVSINTVTKLLVDAGSAALDYQDRVMVNLPCQRIQCDEIWSFVYAKKKNVPKRHQGELGYGDVWTWVALCADTKIVPCWHVGGRDAGFAFEFLADLRPRLTKRVQLTTDGHGAYLEAVEANFGGRCGLRAACEDLRPTCGS